MRIADIDIADVVGKITYDHIANTYNDHTSLFKCLRTLIPDFNHNTFADQIGFCLKINQVIINSHFDRPQDNVFLVPDYVSISSSTNKQYLYITVNIDTGYAIVTDDFDEDVATINISHICKTCDGDWEHIERQIRNLMFEVGLIDSSDVVTFDEYINESRNGPRD